MFNPISALRKEKKQEKCRHTHTIFQDKEGRIIEMCYFCKKVLSVNLKKEN